MMVSTRRRRAAAFVALDRLRAFRQLATFAVIGTGGLIVDASVLWLAVHQAGLGPYLGRVVSFLTAATGTWYLNRRFTFGVRTPPRLGSSEWLRYLGASLAGGVLNYGVYCICLVVWELSARHPTLAVAAGSLTGMGVNYMSYGRLVFAPAAPGAITRPAP